MKTREQLKFLEANHGDKCDCCGSDTHGKGVCVDRPAGHIALILCAGCVLPFVRDLADAAEDGLRQLADQT